MAAHRPRRPERRGPRWLIEASTTPNRTSEIPATGIEIIPVIRRRPAR